jgi:hypothetical protein
MMMFVPGLSRSIKFGAAMPKLLRILPALALTVSLPSLAQQFIPVVPPAGPGMPNPYLQMVPVPAMPTVLPFAGMPIPFIGTLQPQPTRPYTRRPGIPQETKRQMMQMMMPIQEQVLWIEVAIQTDVERN